VTAVLLVNAATALAMTGVIWFVQVVHYPLFDGVAPADWPAYHDRHTTRTGYLVAPLMVAEIASSALLVLDRPDGVTAGLAVTGLVLAAITWLLTLGVATRDHGRLSTGWDARIARRLVSAGWGRTAAWTAHGAVALAMLAHA
jgi:hypothetical protein